MSKTELAIYLLVFLMGVGFPFLIGWLKPTKDIVFRIVNKTGEDLNIHQCEYYITCNGKIDSAFVVVSPRAPKEGVNEQMVNTKR